VGVQEGGLDCLPRVFLKRKASWKYQGASQGERLFSQGTGGGLGVSWDDRGWNSVRG